MITLADIDFVRIEAKGLAHRFGRNVLFRDIDLEWDGGTSVAVIGSNGSGKSTFLHIVAGLLTPWRGRVDYHVDGRAIARENRAFQVGLVAPYLQVYDGFSPRENLSFVIRARGMPGHDSGLIDLLLAQVGLLDRADDLVGTFSSGMKQRVKFAAALVADPPVLLLDEPSTNLDEAGRAMVAGVCDAHVARGGILVVATNEASEAAQRPATIDIESFR